MISSPGWKYLAISSTAETMKLMSGSLVLRSGVGTQMLMVSSSRTTEKSVVARNFFCADKLRDLSRGDVLHMRLAAIQAVDLGLQHVNPGHGKAGVGELHRQRQADVAQPDNAHPGRLGFDLLL